MSPDVDAVLRPSIGALHDIYNAFATYRAPGGAFRARQSSSSTRVFGIVLPVCAVARGPLRMGIDDWFRLLQASGLLDEYCGAREASLAFVCASDSIADDGRGELSVALMAGELVQALAHIAEVIARGVGHTE